MKTFLLIFLLFFSTIVNANDIDLSIGLAKWERSDNGTWWQTPFPEQWPNTTNSWSLGISNEINQNLRWNIGYTNLGTISSYGEAVGDDSYGATNNCTTGACPTPDKWYGKGSVEGVYFTLSPQIIYSNIRYFAEIGVWNYEPKSIVYVPLQHPCGLCNPSPEGPNQYFITKSDRMWGQIFGIGVGYKNMNVKYKLYWVDSNDREYPATYQKYTQELSIGYRF